MCYKTSCPLYEHRKLNGIKGVCQNCEYAKRFKRIAYWSRVMLAGAILSFILTTCMIY